jgi:hypothetical protein
MSPTPPLSRAYVAFVLILLAAAFVIAVFTT